MAERGNEAVHKRVSQALSDAAKAWAGAQSTAKVTGTGGRELRSGAVLTFGNAKGQSVEEADTKDLKWAAGVLAENIEDPAKSQWRIKNVELLKAIDQELAER